MSLSVFFKTSSVIRFLCIAFYFVLEVIKKRMIADPWVIDLEWWADVLITLILGTYLINTLMGLIISFKPQMLFHYLKNKLLPKIFYGLELLIFPIFVWMAIDEVRLSFFPKPPDRITKIMNILFEEEKGLGQINKLEAINLSLVALCSLFFIVLFWKFYKRQKRQTSEAA